MSQGLALPGRPKTVAVSQATVRYALDDTVATIAMDDGKVNLFSLPMVEALHAALDRAETEAAAVVLTSDRPGILTASFDLRLFSVGDPEALHATMLRSAELALRVVAFPRPVVVACPGHAFPMGAFLLLAADYRIGARGDFRIGLNEVSIGVSVLSYGLELARHRLSPSYFNRTAVLGEMFAPDEALAAGFFDRAVAPDAVQSVAQEMASAFARLDPAAHQLTKARARAALVGAMRAAVAAEITLMAYREMVARRR